MAEAPRVRTTATHAVETVKKVRGMVKAMNARNLEARAEGQPVVYCFMRNYGDVILRAMDVGIVFTENWAGLCAAKRDAERFLDKSHAEGFSDTLCTYATCGLGFDAMRYELGGETPPDSPDGGMASPCALWGIAMDGCDPRHKWYQATQRYLDVPMYVMGLRTPSVDVDLKEVEGYYVSYVIEELKQAVEFLEKVTGKKMDWDKLNHIIDLSNEASRVWREAYQLRKAIPSPMPTQDAMSAMVPGSFFSGTQEAVDFYEELKAEIKHRVDNKMGVIPNEKYRILWGHGLPPWHSLMLFNFFEDMGAVCVIEATYMPPEPEEIPKEATHPLERLAWGRLRSGRARHEKAQKRSGNTEVEVLIDLIDQYKIDAVVMHRAFTCRLVHCGQMHQLNVLKHYRDMPTLILESDIVDARTFSEVDTRNKIETLIEAMEAHKSSQQ